MPEIKTITSLSDFINKLSELPSSADGPFSTTWYRGQANAVWKLQPKIARNNQFEQGELFLLKKFRQNAIQHLSAKPSSEWEWLFLMQHYGMPTRLLDWSESPLVALYFAVTDDGQDENDGAIWCLDPIALNNSANIRFAYNTEIPAFDFEDMLDQYLPSKLAAERTSFQRPVAAIAMRNSPRIIAQHGTFTVTHREHFAIEEPADNTHVIKFIIPSASKPTIIKELEVLKVNSLSLFPELGNVAKEALNFLK